MGFIRSRINQFCLLSPLSPSFTSIPLPPSYLSPPPRVLHSFSTPPLSLSCPYLPLILPLSVVSRFGLVVRRYAWKRTREVWVRLGLERTSFLHPLQQLWFTNTVFCHWLDNNKTLQWLRQLSTLLQSHVGGDSAASRCSSIRQLHKSPPPPLFPTSP